MGQVQPACCGLSWLDDVVCGTEPLATIEFAPCFPTRDPLAKCFESHYLVFNMATPPLTPRELVDRLDSRHDELIAKLDELNAQIEAALAEFGRAREPAEEKPARAA